MHRPLTRTLLLSAAALALPAGASAATITVPPKCYVDLGGGKTEPIPFSIAGLAPGQTANASLAGPSGVTAAPLQFGPADAAGNSTGSLTWTDGFKKLTPTKATAATLTVTDAATGAPIGTAPVTVGNAGLKVGATRFKTVKTKIPWTVSGLAPAAGGSSTYYVHYIKAKDAAASRFKVVDTMKLGTSKDPCGYLKVKRPLAPFTKSGTYVAVVQTSPKFEEQGLALAGAIRIKRARKD